MNPALAKRNKINSISKCGGNNRLPSWFRQEIPGADTLEKIALVSASGVHTVCQEAQCPNIHRCFKNSQLTFMILGDACTRNCRFCGVKRAGDIPLAVDPDEPKRISRMVEILGLKYAIITSVTRDDLADGGAGQFARTIKLIRQINPQIKVEVLIPDFLKKTASLSAVIEAGPCVVAHNLETVKRLYQALKPKADYEISLGVFRKIKALNPALLTKSSLLLGLGEREEEITQAMRDLRSVACDILTLGQYLAPSDNHYPVKEFIRPEQFAQYRAMALSLGFKAVLAGPLVRSSYRAEEIYQEVTHV